MCQLKTQLRLAVLAGCILSKFSRVAFDYRHNRSTTATAVRWSHPSLRLRSEKFGQGINMHLVIFHVVRQPVVFDHGRSVRPRFSGCIPPRLADSPRSSPFLRGFNFCQIAGEEMMKSNSVHSVKLLFVALWPA